MTMRFGSFTALDDVSIKVPAGSFHALLGENGAGKSTLVKCMMGFYHPTSGQMLVDGREVAIASPKDASALGLGMVYQHFTLVPSLTGAENLVISREDVPRRHRLGQGAQGARRVHGDDAVQAAARRAGARARRRREAEAGDHQAALSRPAFPGARRADLGADARRGDGGARAGARHDASAATSPC